VKASKLTARGLAYVVRGVGRKIAKHHRAKQTPHGKQSVKKLMAHGASASSIELSGDTKLFDRVARKWNVDYAFYKTGPDKYLLFFKAGQADAMTACFSEYSRKVLNKSKSRRIPINTLQTLVVALGAGLGVWGVVNLLEGYGSDNPGANAHVR